MSYKEVSYIDFKIDFSKFLKTTLKPVKLLYFLESFEENSKKEISSFLFQKEGKNSLESLLNILGFAPINSKITDVINISGFNKFESDFYNYFRVSFLNELKRIYADSKKIIPFQEKILRLELGIFSNKNFKNYLQNISSSQINLDFLSKPLGLGLVFLNSDKGKLISNQDFFEKNNMKLPEEFLQITKTLYFKMLSKHYQDKITYS